MQRNAVTFNTQETKDPPFWTEVVIEILERKGYDYELDPESSVISWEEEPWACQTYDFDVQEELYDMRVNKGHSYPKIRRLTGCYYGAVQTAIREVERRNAMKPKNTKILAKWNLKEFLENVGKRVLCE